MRRLVVFVVAVAAVARATPAPSLTWADWVGDWEGKLAWSGCTIDGKPSASVAIDATDGAIAIDLAPAGGALGVLSLVEDRDGWLGQSGDVAVRLVHGRDSLELAVELQSGCAVHGSLKRASVGLAACDALDAWARIEDHCTKLAKPRLENLARLVRQRSEWIKAGGEDRAALASRCAARTAKVAAELAEVGCAPDPNPIAARGPECQALRQTAAKLTRCGTLPFDLATSLAHDANQLAASIAGAESDTSVRIVEGRCRELRSQLTTAGQQAGCAM